MPRACAHLVGNSDLDFAYWFSGVGLEYALICTTCHDAPSAIESNLETVDAEHFAQIEADVCWSEFPSIGRPEILERSTELRFRHEDVELRGEIAPGIAALAPIPSSERGECLVLARNGDLVRVDPARGSIRRLTTGAIPSAADNPAWSLIVSPGGEIAAVVETRGRYGAVLDLGSGRTTMRLDRGDYYPDKSDFPAAFFVRDGRLLLIHGTDWNRLDVSDPCTGELLTERSPTSYQSGEKRPDHYLDYFHGRLVVSPGNDWVLDDGWVWHSVGVVQSWNLRRWVGENRWESEDGPSKRLLAYRAYFWNGPICWIDEKTAAVWGFGCDDDNLIPAALLIEVETGRRIRWFAGPIGSFTYDRYLFSSSVEEGTSVWDVATGERLLRDGEFRPAVYHPGARRFVTILPGDQLRISRLAES